MKMRREKDFFNEETYDYAVVSKGGCDDSSGRGKKKKRKAEKKTEKKTEWIHVHKRKSMHVKYPVTHVSIRWAMEI